MSQTDRVTTPHETRPAPPSPYSDGFWETVVAHGLGPEAVARVIQTCAAEGLAGSWAYRGFAALSELECAAEMARARARLDRKSREERAEIRRRAANPLGEKIAVAFRSGWGKASRPTGKTRRA